MGNRLKRSNTYFIVLIVSGLAGMVYQANEIRAINKANHQLSSGIELDNDHYTFEKKFAEAHYQGAKGNFKHAVQSYSQLLESANGQAPLNASQQSQVQFNIANNLFQSGLARLVNADGSLQDDAKYAYAQAKVAYEQALKLDPGMREARFNLSLLHAIIPKNMKIGVREQSGMELSNLPLGLP